MPLSFYIYLLRKKILLSVVNDTFIWYKLYLLELIIHDLPTYFGFKYDLLFFFFGNKVIRYVFLAIIASNSLSEFYFIKLDSRTNLELLNLTLKIKTTIYFYLHLQCMNYLMCCRPTICQILLLQRKPTLYMYDYCQKNMTCPKTKKVANLR